MALHIIFATSNEHKLREIRQILKEAGVEADVLSMREAGFTDDIRETGETFAENALCKVRAVYKAFPSRTNPGTVFLADDSGLVVDALHGEPGIYSARYLGEQTPYDIKNADILRRMEGIPERKRSARFVCAVAAKFADGTEQVTEADFEGRIAYEPSGENGFGYDPILYLPAFGCTSAALPGAEKNRISHRGKALREMAARIALKQNN